MDQQRYRAVRRKVRSKPERERNLELVRIIKAGDAANRAAYENLRNSGLDEDVAETILDVRHMRRSRFAVHPTWAVALQLFKDGRFGSAYLAPLFL
jgi:hypothetical protein